MGALLTFLFVFLNSLSPNNLPNNGGVSNPNDTSTTQNAKIIDEYGG